MDYSTAERTRKKGFTGTLADKLLEGGSVGGSIRESIGESLKARAVGFKQKFDPMNIAKVLTGGSNLAPAIVGRLMGRKMEDISFFTGGKGKDPNYTTIGDGKPQNLKRGDSKADILVKMYRFMKTDIEFREKRDKEIDKYRKQLSDAKDRRTEELIKALVDGEDIRKKKTEDSSLLKYGLLGAIGLGAMLYSSDAKAMAKKFTDDAKRMVDDFDVIDMFKTIIFGEKQKGIKLTTGQDEQQKMVYNAFIEAGLSEKQAMAMAAEVGREGDYKLEHLYGEHIDPANKAKNLGMLSWQGERREKLLAELKSKGLVESEDERGIRLKRGQETLNVMAKYSVGEMRKSEPGKRFLGKTDISQEEAIPELGKFIGWRYTDPKYATQGIKKSKEYYGKIQGAFQKEITSFQSISPVDGGTITSEFGVRKHPLTGFFKPHEGMDIAAKEGSPVKSVASGTITFAGNKSGYGNIIEVDHGGGNKTRYAHLATMTAVAGQQVSAGQVIGTVGSTGRSTGPHLHFETLQNDKQVDPKVALSTIPSREIPTRERTIKTASAGAPVVLSHNTNMMNSNKTTNLLPPTIDDNPPLMVKQYG